MCNKLLQTYACGHSKTICTTPCAHALKSTSVSTPLDSSTGNITRPNSTVSIAPAEAPSPATTLSRLNSTSRASSTAVSSPLHITNLPPVQTSPTRGPAFRFVPPSTPSPTSPVSPVSPSFPGSAQASAPPSRFPSPSSSPSLAVREVEPNFCSYYIPRHLTTSKHPCVECYGRPEWEALRGRWMESYRLGHPLDRVEGVDVLSGVREVMERAGLK